MLLKERPVGIWILALWAVAHTALGALVAADVGGAKGVLAWLCVALEAIVAAGLLIPWRIARYLLIVQLAATVFVLAVPAWAFAFVAAAWGLHPTDAPVVVVILCWAFVYLFHPGVRDYFAGLVNRLAL